VLDLEEEHRMTRLTDSVDFVIGVDTHKRTHSIAVLDRSGGIQFRSTDTTDPAGLDRLIVAARQHAPGRRLWAIEQTGSYGSTLTVTLGEEGEEVVEIDRPARPARKNGAKDDDLDAVRAAREALGREHLAHPRARGSREALRVLVATRRAAVLARVAAVCQLKSLVVSAPVELRESLRGLSTTELIRSCARLHRMARHDDERRGTVLALRSTARRIEFLTEEVEEIASELERLVRATHPELLELPGVGVLVAAQLLVSWSHPGRLRSEAAFAAMAGASPVPASSGEIIRHRLNRSGDRQLNRALHNIVLSRMRFDPSTRAYVVRRQGEGRSKREIQRCLKRSVARQLFRFLERQALPTQT
jgi:transposase